MNISGKVWGYTQELVKGASFEVHRIEIKEGGFCSLHRHLHKNNAFFVESGFIEVEVCKIDYNLVDKTNLQKGEMTVVKAGEYHKFKGIKESVVYEIYWTDNISEDIDRKEVGGFNDLSNSSINIKEEES